MLKVSLILEIIKYMWTFKKREKLLLSLSEKDPIVLECVTHVLAHFKVKKKAFLWFFVRNPHFGDIAPIEMFLLGKSQKVLNFILDMKSLQEKPDDITS